MGSFARDDAVETEKALRAFGRHLKSLRVAAGLSQSALALRVFVRAPHVSELERGRRAPTLHLLVSLASALGVSADDLTAGIRPIERPGSTKAALGLIVRNPGIRSPELARELGFGPAHAQSTVHALQRDGRIICEGEGWRAGQKAAQVPGVWEVPSAVVPELRGELWAALSVGAQDLNERLSAEDSAQTTVVLARLQAHHRLLGLVGAGRVSGRAGVRLTRIEDRVLALELLSERVHAREELVGLGEVDQREPPEITAVKRFLSQVRK